MSTDHITFAGLALASGRKPVTFAALDHDLNINSVATWDVSEAISCLRDYGTIWLAMSRSSRKPEAVQELKQHVLQAGFTPYPRANDARQLIVTDAQDCFRALIGHKALPRRTLEGRLQRSAVLYEQGLPLTDPMEVFEEITRYRLVRGILPLENIFSASSLDALVAAYLAWLAANRPGQTVALGEFVLPTRE